MNRGSSSQRTLTGDRRRARRNEVMVDGASCALETRTSGRRVQKLEDVGEACGRFRPDARLTPERVGAGCDAVGAHSKLRLDAPGLQWIPRCTARCPSLWKPTSRWKRSGRCLSGATSERTTGELALPAEGRRGSRGSRGNTSHPEPSIAREAVAVKSRGIPE